MSDLLFYLAAFGLVIGVLVVFHELGHYLAARACGVKVLRFSFGFGQILWRRVIGRDGTEWVISAFPLGGYVKMLDEREGEVDAAEQHRAFNRQTVGKRSFIVAAGPFANFLLAFLLYWGIFMHGSDELLPVLGEPPAASAAAAAGIVAGEEVRRIDGEAVLSWSDFRWMVLRKAVDQESVDLELADETGRIVRRRLALAATAESGWEGDAFERLGLVLFRPILPPVIGKLVANGPAARAGLREGDRVVSIDGRAIAAWHELVLQIRQAAGRDVHIVVLRGQETLTVDVRPDEISEGGQTFGRIGVAVADTGLPQREMRTFVRHDFFDAGQRALRETWEKSVFSLVMFGKMLIGEVSWKNLSGPVTIADYAGQSARLGLEYYVKFMALVSISLGVLNLLPVPVLDGGHLMYHMIEVVRRRPLSERAMAIGQQVGMYLLFALMAFAFFNDLNRLFSG